MDSIALTTVTEVNKLIALTPLTTSNAFIYNVNPEAADDRFFIMVDNTDGAEAVSVSLNAGDFVGGARASLGQVASGAIGVVFVDSARFDSKNGIKISLVPSNGGAKMGALQFMPVANH